MRASIGEFSTPSANQKVPWAIKGVTGEGAGIALDLNEKEPDRRADQPCLGISDGSFKLHRDKEAVNAVRVLSRRWRQREDYVINRNGNPSLLCPHRTNPMGNPSH
jgi:hypothetical protein